MNDQQFHAKVDKVFGQIEEWLEEVEEEVEVESQEGILMISLPKGSQLVLSRQPTLQEIWLAARGVGAFHFRATSQGWCTHQGHLLISTLTQLIRQSGVTIQELQID